MFSPRFLPAKSRGFTLVEMLVTIGIIGVLAVILSGGTKAVIMTSRKAESVSTMRGLGMALLNYAGENQTMPGPLRGQQDPRFSSAKSLPYHIWQYFQKEEPADLSLNRWFVTKQWADWYNKSTDKEGKVVYTLCDPFAGSDGKLISPWGAVDQDPSNPVAQINWSRFASEVNLSKQFMFGESFATSKKPRRGPKEGAIQNFYTRVFFDGHVETFKL